MQIYTYIIILIIILLLIQYQNRYHHYTKWYQCYDKNNIHKVFHTALKKADITRTYENDWDLYLPCNSKYNMKAIKKIPITNKHQLINIIPQNGILGSKEHLWRILVKHYGRDYASTIMPSSYILPEDIHYFNIEYNNGNIFVLKTEEQRQLGLTITDDYNEIIRCNNKDSKKCKIVQRYIPNSLTYKGHKINFRVYLLIVCNGHNINSYIYDDGIVSYSKEVSIDNNPSFDSSVASFYTSKELYDKDYPILISQLSKDLGINSNNLYIKFRKQAKNVMDASKEHICNYKYRYNNTSFQIFGIDYLVTDNLVPYILEINIGPGMIPYGNIDKRLREDMHSDILNILNITDTECKFTKI